MVALSSSSARRLQASSALRPSPCSVWCRAQLPGTGLTGSKQLPGAAPNLSQVLRPNVEPSARSGTEVRVSSFAGPSPTSTVPRPPSPSAAPPAPSARNAPPANGAPKPSAANGAAVEVTARPAQPSIKVVLPKRELQLPLPTVPADVIEEFEHKLEADLQTVAVTITAIMGVIFFWRGVWSLLDHFIGDSVLGDICCIIVGLSIVMYIRLSGLKIASFWPDG